MIAYHLDRCNSLKENSYLSLEPTGIPSTDSLAAIFGFDFVSNWGRQMYELYTSSPDPSNFQSYISLQIDMQAENVRKSHFPDSPSRFKSIFAVPKLSDFSLWRDSLQIDENASIFEIEYDPQTVVQLDATFLIGSIGSDPFHQWESLFRYWSGEMSSNPLPELLIPLPVFTRKCLRVNELIF